MAEGCKSDVESARIQSCGRVAFAVDEIASDSKTGLMKVVLAHSRVGADLIGFRCALPEVAGKFVSDN